jgi:hypothetical protein
MHTESVEEEPTEDAKAFYAASQEPLHSFTANYSGTLNGN